MPQRFTAPTSSLPPYLALAAGIFCIGFSAIFVKLAGVPGGVSAFYRVLFAEAVMGVWWLARPREIPARPELRLILGGGVFFALDLALWNTSLLLTSAATATLLANNAPLWVGLGAMLFFHERLSPQYWIGLFLALAGMAVILGVEAWAGLRFNLGDLLAVSASFFYAAYLLTTQHARQRVDTRTFMTLSMASSLLLLLALNLVTGAPLTGYPPGAWAALLALGLVSQLGGWLAINYALGRLRAAPVSVTLLGQVLVTALFSILLLGETLSAEQVLGGALVLGGIILVNRGRAPS
jgi:drug/metabolite transporter (DMT)-like permease